MAMSKKDSGEVDRTIQYIRNADDAETRSERLFWEILTCFSVFLDALRFLWSDFKTGSKWRLKLLLGHLSKRQETCGFKDCENQSVTTYEYNDGSHHRVLPACRFHYVTVKGALYAAITAALTIYIAATYYLVPL